MDFFKKILCACASSAPYGLLMKFRHLILGFIFAVGTFGLASTSHAQSSATNGLTPIFITFLDEVSSGNSFVYNYSIAASTNTGSDDFIGANSSVYIKNLGGVTSVYETGYTAQTSPDFYNFSYGTGASLGTKATFNFNNSTDGIVGQTYYFTIVSTQPIGVNTGLYATQNQDDGSQVQGGLISAPLPVSAVPEPSTLAMSFLLGAGLVTFLARCSERKLFFGWRASLS
jgi:hypothetical protein